MTQEKRCLNQSVQEAKSALETRLSEVSEFFEYHLMMFKKYKRERDQLEKKLSFFKPEMINQRGDE